MKKIKDDYKFCLDPDCKTFSKITNKQLEEYFENFSWIWENQPKRQRWI